ncbi:MAG: hypothetical protein RLO22_00010 [Sneathiellaceae bacterium]
MARFAAQDEIYEAEFADFGGIDAIDEFTRRPTDDRLLPELEDEDGLSGAELLRLMGDGEPEPARWH